jgi:hypothetical protein
MMVPDVVVPVLPDPRLKPLQLSRVPLVMVPPWFCQVVRRFIQKCCW